MSRSVHLTTYDLYRLDLAVSPLRNLSPMIYLVGSALEGAEYRDVDVRMIMPDEEFDALFRESNGSLWQILCMGVTAWLREQTGLPIDFQIQRQSNANEKHDGPRNHLSGGGRRLYAGLGDGTGW